ncbi:MAG: MgtC/SapB family protein [Nitrospiraceae bacterium]|nr:MAG: MgtC/SapB family protein [Nitrospiraceae bacterium]
MIPASEIIIRLLLAAVIGGIIGFEREVHGRAAGFRTQLIVCVAAVLIMIVSENYYHYMHSIDQSLRIDPARISAGALIGIGFLGAGVIIKSGFAVRGLTTAASIWIVSAIGLAIGGGLYLEAVLTATITIIALMVLRILENRIRTLRFKNIIISSSVDDNVEDQVLTRFAETGFHVHSVDYEKNRDSGELKYHFTVSVRDKNAIKEIFLQLSSIDSITYVKVFG